MDKSSLDKSPYALKLTWTKDHIDRAREAFLKGGTKFYSCGHLFSGHLSVHCYPVGI